MTDSTSFVETVDLDHYRDSVNLAEDGPLWTDVAQAWGTMIGAGGSILAVLAAALLLRHERRIRDAEQRDSEAAQARTVDVFVGGDGDAGKGMRTVTWKVTNYSSEPLRGAMVIIERLDEDGSGDDFYTERVGMIPPGGDEHSRWRLDPFVPWPAGETEPPMHFIRWSVEILDARGLIWELEDGQLPRRHLVGPRRRWWHRQRRRLG